MGNLIGDYQRLGEKLFQLRQMMQTVYGVETRFQGWIATVFQANENGEVFLLDIAGKWIDDLEDENKENFLNRKSSNVVLHAEKDVAAWLNDKMRSAGRYDALKLSAERLSLLVKVIIEEVIMTRYDQLTEESKVKALSAPDSNMLFCSQKRIIAMYEGILKPDGFRLTGPDVEVLQAAISIEIDAAKQRRQQAAAPAVNQKPKKDSPIIEAVKSWQPGKRRPKVFYTEIERIKKRLKVGTRQAVIIFCSDYGFSGQEKAFEKSYEGYCRVLVKKPTKEPR